MQFQFIRNRKLDVIRPFCDTLVGMIHAIPVYTGIALPEMH